MFINRKMKPIYPIDYRLKFIDRLLNRMPFLFYCNTCGRLSIAKPRSLNNPYIELRESIICFFCRSSNRNRQIASVILNSEMIKKNYFSLREFALKEKFIIYNTENERSVHDSLKRMTGYVSSEYLGEKYNSGEIVDGIMHQDIMETSFPDNCYDIVLSSDILEHVSDPWKAFKEIYRILKPGGSHIFTVPFYQDRSCGEVRAILENKKITYLKEPIYHIDPLRPEGTLVFNIFSIDILPELEKIGFETKMYKVHSIFNGILGENAIVFESKKRPY